jgi:hypothetical protein
VRERVRGSKGGESESEEEETWATDRVEAAASAQGHKVVYGVNAVHTAINQGSFCIHAPRQYRVCVCVV